jgi:2,4-dienoyl-CoA reductase-like NADH-dependent reductase (Old Yellow Enzyme family)
MWKPPQRIKHKPGPGAWPSAAQAAQSRWFSPIALGPVTLETRTWVPAMVPWRATEEGFVTDAVLAWYERFAHGRPGALVVEATGIRDIASGPLLRIGHDRFIPGLRELADTVHRASEGHTRVLIQIIDFLNIRRRPEPARYFERFLAVNARHRDLLGVDSDAAVRAHLAQADDAEVERVLDARELEALRMGYRERVTDLHLPHIRELPRVLPELFADAARRARESGFDGVELHYAHAYTMASFLSALNTRDDGYGGERAARARLPLEVYRRVREIVGPDYCVGCRYLSEDCIAGGNTVEDAQYFGVEFARAGMDFLSLSRGGKFEDALQPEIGWSSYPYTGPSGYECMPVAISDAFGPFGRNVGPAARIRAAIRAAGFSTPVAVIGGIHGFEQAEAILRRGEADIVGSARQSLADPDWFRKVQLGRGTEVRPCKFTNYCEALDQRHKIVTCQLWDRDQLDETGVKMTPDGKRRMTAPSWPAPGA